MPRYPHITCPTCGATRLLHNYRLDAEPPQPHETFLKTKVTPDPGSKGVRWETGPLDRPAAEALRRHMAAALAQLDAELGRC